MPDKHTAFPFRWAFPIGELLLCAILLWPLRSELLADLRPKASPPPRQHVAIPIVPAQPNERPGLTIIQVGSVPPPDQRVERLRQLRLSIPASLNFPAGFFNYFIASWVTDNSRPYDDKFRESWSAVTWPLLAIVFWWMAGRAVEALLAARQKLLVPRIGPPEVTVAIVLLFFGGGLALQIGLSGESRDLDSYLLVWGAALWGLIGAVMLLARIVQWRVRKALNPAPEPTKSLENL